MKMNIRQKKVVEAKENKIICLATAASGKAIPIDTIIPTPNGWKIADEIKVGDYLINELGQPTKVLGVYPQGKKEVYKITFGDGREAKCCKEHIWSVNKITWKDKNEYRDYTVTQLLEEGLIYKDRRAKFSIPCSSPIQWPEKEYDIDPYIIGAFLGDGCCIGKSQLVLASENEHIPLLCAEKMGTNVKTELWYNNKYQWRFYIENGIEKKYFNRLEYFKKYKKEILQYSYNKSIPQEYKVGSIEQRLSLIQGLMDTDGCIEKRSGHVSFTSTSFSLIKDVQEVLNSLGYVSRLFQEKRKELYTDTCYSLSINIPNKEKEKLFRLKRKKDIALTFSNVTQKHDYSRTTIRSIEKINELKEMVCFYVDNPKHLFLMNDCIVTHNTTVLTERIRYLVNNNVEPEKIAAISFTSMAADEMKERLGEQGYGMFIGTIHSLANNILIENGIDTTEIIKNEKFDTLLKKALTIPQKKIQTFEHVLVDEFQDISELEYNFIEHIPKKNIYLTGDERQMIYGFKGSSDKFLRDLCEDASYKVYYLVDNYRNPPNIIKFAEDLIGSLEKISPPSNPTKQFNGHIEKCSFYEALEEMEWSQDWANWYIICRTNNEVAAAMSILDRKGIPYVSFKRGDTDLVEMNSMLRDNRVKILTVHAMKGLEGKNVIAIGARLYNDEERRIAYVAATRAESSLYWCPSIAKRTKGGPTPANIKHSNDVMKKFSKKMVNFGG